MRVLIDTSYAARGHSGSGVYIEQLVRALRARGVVEVVEARMPRRPPPARHAGGAPAPLRSALNGALDSDWLHRGLPAAARAARADVVHHPLPAHSPRIACPQVVTILDLAVITHRGGYGRIWGTLARRRLRAAAHRAQALVCISHATAEDAVRLLGAPRERIVVAQLGPGQARPAAAEPRRDRGHLLYVGDAEPRKNVEGLLSAYAVYRGRAADPAALVLAGAASALAEGAGAGVRGAGRPPAAELLDLIGSARALVHPSLHEGFGLTPLEAMALGTPVVAVRNAAVEEVCADAALLCEAAGLADAIERIDADAALRERLGAAGRERAALFTWDATARAHEAAYTLARG